MDLRQPSCVIFKDITKTFKGKKSKTLIKVFKDFSLKLPLEETDRIIALIGRSGSGKTTMLRLISGLEMPDAGSIFVNNQIVKGPTGQTTLIPQQFTCFPWLTVYENIDFGLNLNNNKNTREIVLRIAKELGLYDRLNDYPKELSGGMQQRVAIGRALAVNTPILLMDEPFGSLDAETRGQMQKIIIDISEKLNKLIFLVTHDLNEAILLSDVIIIFPDKPISMVSNIIRIPFMRPRNSDLIHSTEFSALYQKIKKLL
jgi:NitT/TauT family transport system ATP-binding protein